MSAEVFSLEIRQERNAGMILMIALLITALLIGLIWCIPDGAGNKNTPPGAVLIRSEGGAYA